MRILCTFLFLFNIIFVDAQTPLPDGSSTYRLKAISDGSVGGCEQGCVDAGICPEKRTGNAAQQTNSLTFSVPANRKVNVSVTEGNSCNGSSIDNSDGFTIGSESFTGASNGGSSCANTSGGAGTLSITVSANRADEYIDIQITSTVISSSPSDCPNPLPASTLPVTLTSFEAVAEGGEVDLKWTTATEINNDNFAVQHSVDGVHFEDIAMVNGNGNSTETITYEYKHTTPASGVNYYRLKQVDFDGGYEYHGVETVVVAEAGEITIYPSVITDEVYVNAPSYKNGKVVVFDAVGQVVLTQALTTRSVSLVDLTAGTYIIKVIADGATATEKIVKL